MEENMLLAHILYKFYVINRKRNHWFDDQKCWHTCCHCLRFNAIYTKHYSNGTFAYAC